MKASAAMENLWLYLQSLPRSNKQWLADRLIEDLQPPEGLRDVKAGRTRPAEELLNELRNGISD